MEIVSVRVASLKQKPPRKIKASKSAVMVSKPVVTFSKPLVSFYDAGDTRKPEEPVLKRKFRGISPVIHMVETVKVRPGDKKPIIPKKSATTDRRDKWIQSLSEEQHRQYESVKVTKPTEEEKRQQSQQMKRDFARWSKEK